MGMYRCDECQELKDDDYSPCIEWNEGQLLCESCQEEHACEWCGIASEDVKDNWHPHCLVDYRAEKRVEQ